MYDLPYSCVLIYGTDGSSSTAVLSKTASSSGGLLRPHAKTALTAVLALPDHRKVPPVECSGSYRQRSWRNRQKPYVGANKRNNQLPAFPSPAYSYNS